MGVSTTSHTPTLYLVTLSPYPLPSGLSTRINNLSKQLIVNGIIINMVATLFCGELSSPNDINRVSSKARINGFKTFLVRATEGNKFFTILPLSLLIFFRISRAVSNRETKVIQFMDEISFLPALLAKLIYGAVIIGDDICLRHKLYSFPLKHIVRAYEMLVITCTDVITTSFSDDYRLMKEIRKDKKTIFVPNGIEINQHKLVGKNKKNWKRIVHISSSFGKGTKLALGYLLDVADLLCKQFEDVKLWIVGGNVLPELASDRQSVLQNFVEFLGYVSSDHLSRIYEKAAIGILPYFGETAHSSQRTKTLEYFANGLLVISSKEDLKGFKGLLLGTHCIAVSSPEEMTNVMKDVLHHPERFIKMAEMGKKFITENYTWQRVTTDYIKLVKELI